MADLKFGSRGGGVNGSGDGTFIKVDGLKELQAAINRLGNNLDKKAVKSGLAAAGKVIREEAKAIAKSKNLKKSGALIKNIAIKHERQSKGQYEHEIHVGVRHGKSRGKDNDPYYWWFLEFGTSKITAKPFMAPAFETKKVVAVDSFKEAVSKMVNKMGQNQGRL